MRSALGMFVGVFVAAALVGCGGDDSSPGLRNGKTETNAPGAPNNSGTTDPAGGGVTTTPAEQACASAPVATALSDVKDAKDAHLAGKAVFFTSGPKVLRVTKDGKATKEIYTSTDLVRSYVDATSLIVLEAAADAPDTTTIRVIKANPADVTPNADPAAPAIVPSKDFPEFPAAKDGALGTTTTTNFNAAGTRIFASDETSFYVLADTAAGTTIVRFKKDTLAQTNIVTTTNAIKNPQVASNAVWYVRDEQRVFKVAINVTDDNGNVTDAVGEPTEVFGVSYSNVNLAVNDSAAFITTGEAIERRDLTGANPTTIFDAQKSKVSARLGMSTINGGALYVGSEQADAKVKHVIREVKLGATGDERLIACGRSLIGGMAVDAANVVWTEESGVFIAPR